MLVFFATLLYFFKQPQTPNITLLDSLQHRKHPLNKYVGYLHQIHAIPLNHATLPGILFHIFSLSVFETSQTDTHKHTHPLTENLVGMLAFLRYKDIAYYIHSPLGQRKG